MTIYLDLLIIINFIFDYIILSIVNKLLKRNTKIYRLLISGILGELSILFLYINNNYILNILKILLLIIMVLTSFGYKNILNNLLYTYLVSVILGGLIYYLKININITIVTYILGIYLLYKLIELITKLKLNYNNYYEMILYFDKNNYINVNGFLDTGNKLKDPITNKSIILINKNIYKENIRSPMYIPYKTLNNHGLLKCYKGYKLIINNRSTRNFLIGISEQDISIDGVDCIINNNILEELL